METKHPALFPVNLMMEGRACLVVGGGQVAARKVASLLSAGAVVTVISPELEPGLKVLAEAGRIRHIADEYRNDVPMEYFLVFATTNDPEINLSVAARAKAAGALVNVADAAEVGDFNVPAQVARGDLLLTVSTGGKSPGLARLLRQELAARYGAEYGEYLELVARLRAELKACIADSGDRCCFWRETLDEETLELLRAGRVQEAEDKLREAVCGVSGQAGHRTE